MAPLEADAAKSSPPKRVRKVHPNVASLVSELQEALERLDEFDHRLKDTEVARNLTPVLNRLDSAVSRAESRLDQVTKLGLVLYKKNQGDFYRIRSTYLASMELQAPVKYWRDKGEQHEAKVKFLTRYLVLAAIGVVVLPIFALWAANWGLLPSPALPADAPDWAKVAASAKGIVAAILFSGVAVWGLRILSKIYLSERHLAQDARERVTMITTYLALIKEKGAGETDKSIILQAIFRATTDGIVKDDGTIDPSVLGLLSKLMEKR